MEPPTVQCHPMDFLSMIVSLHGIFDKPLVGFKILAVVSQLERDKMILLTEVGRRVIERRLQIELSPEATATLSE